MQKRIKYGNFHLVAGIWSDNGWTVQIFIVVDVSFASIQYSKYGHAHPLYQTIFWQPNKNFHLLFAKYLLIDVINYGARITEFPFKFRKEDWDKS